MAETQNLDSIVKGAPIPGHAPDPSKAAIGTTPVSGPAVTTPSDELSKHGSTETADPLSHTPSSPSMIYLNLLILEASLRAQYLELRARRRHHSFFLALLSLWVAGFGYALFLAPREDGRGVGGSVYWVVEVTEKVCFMGGLITAILVWGTGIWERGVRWPRRWFATSNRGLRGFNCKLVIAKRPWWREMAGLVRWGIAGGGLFVSHAAGGASASYRYVEPGVLREVEKEMGIDRTGHPAMPVGIGGGVGDDEEKAGGREEDLAPGGDYVKLLLLAKPFSATFRENWELYRTEYWERENERRALIRAKLREREKAARKAAGGWFWWLPWKKNAVQVRGGTPPLSEKGHHQHHQAHHPRHSAIEREHKRTRSGSVRRGSMSSSRSPTPALEADEGHKLEPGGIVRNSSTASNASDHKRRKKPSMSTKTSSASVTTRRPTVDSRSVTPEIASPLARKSSGASEAGTGRTARGSATASPGSSTPARE